MQNDSSKLKNNFLEYFAIIFIYFVFGIITQLNSILGGTIIASSFALFGYFVVHSLNLQQKRQEKKLDIALKLMRSLRLFLDETEAIHDKEKLKVFVDRFQDIYYQFSLVISKEGYRKLMDVTERYKKLRDNLGNKGYIEDFQKDLKNFVNQMRKELLNEKEIDFGTYDFITKGKK